MHSYVFHAFHGFFRYAAHSETILAESRALFKMTFSVSLAMSFLINSFVCKLLEKQFSNDCRKLSNHGNAIAALGDWLKNPTNEKRDQNQSHLVRANFPAL